MRWCRKRSSPKAPMTSIDRRPLALLRPSGPGQLQCRRHHGHLVLDVFAEHQDVEHRQLGEEATVLEGADHPDALAFLGQVLGQVRPVEPHGALLGRDQARHHVERRGLPRPVGADQTDDGAGLRVKADVVDRADTAEGHAEVLDGQPGRTRGADPAPAHDSTTSGTRASDPARVTWSGSTPGGGAPERRPAQPFLARNAHPRARIDRAVEKLTQAAGKVEDEGDQPEATGQELNGRVGPEERRKALEIQRTEHRPRERTPGRRSRPWR